MIQAWDFVDANVLWGRTGQGIATMHKRVSDCDWTKGIGARVMHTSAIWLTEEERWKNFQTLGDIARMTESELMRCPNIGRVAVTEIKRVLKEHGLHLGMT